jgi:ferredoxin
MSGSISTAATYQVDFEPVGKRIQVVPNITLLEAAQQAGLALSSACGGVGNCGQCRVAILSLPIAPPTRKRVSMSSVVPRQKVPGLSSSRCLPYWSNNI